MIVEKIAKVPTTWDIYLEEDKIGKIGEVEIYSDPNSDEFRNEIDSKIERKDWNQAIPRDSMLPPIKRNN